METAKPTILILTTHTGGGHLNLAHSLKEMLADHYEIVIVDPQSALVDRWYAAVSRYFVPFLQWQYLCTDNPFASFCIHQFITVTSLQHYCAIIERIQPSLIITTHAFLSYVTARAIRRSQKHIPLVFQLTDLEELHITWFAEKEAAAYLAPSREIHAQTIAQGIKKERVHATGRPVRGQFLRISHEEKQTLRSTLHLDPDTLTIFLQGGAKGSASVDRTIEVLQTIHPPVQIILAVGNNQQMAARYASHQQVRVVPFTEKIAPYMAVADVIAGKAGASFITEAFMLEKPFIVTAFIPGQETPNLRFIEQHNLGWICPDIAAQQKLFTSIAHDPGLISAKITSIQGYRAWNIQANQHIRQIIDQLLARKASYDTASSS